MSVSSHLIIISHSCPDPLYLYISISISHLFLPPPSRLDAFLRLTFGTLSSDATFSPRCPTRRRSRCICAFPVVTLRACKPARTRYFTGDGRRRRLLLTTCVMTFLAFYASYALFNLRLRGLTFSPCHHYALPRIPFSIITLPPTPRCASCGVFAHACASARLLLRSASIPACRSYAAFIPLTRRHVTPRQRCRFRVIVTPLVLTL